MTHTPTPWRVEQHGYIFGNDSQSVLATARAYRDIDAAFIVCAVNNHQALIEALASARLMLYAWKAARKNFKLPDNHSELNAAIEQVESVLEQAKCS